MLDVIFGVSMFVIGVPVAFAAVGSAALFVTALAVTRAENGNRLN
jgi:hypothetical protein